MLFGGHVYQVKTMCRMQEWSLILAGLSSYLPWMNFKGEACALNNSYTLQDILMIFSRHVYQVKKVCRVQEWLLLLSGLLSYLP